MSPPAVFAWAEDPPLLKAEGVSIDPVTAWALLSQPDPPDDRDLMFFTVFDTSGNPAEVLKKQGTIPTVLRVDPCRTHGLSESFCTTLRDDLGIREPRLFAMPLRRGSLPKDIDDLVEFDPAGGFSRAALSATTPLADLPPLGSRQPLHSTLVRPIRPRVIVGIIDYAINLVHARFQHLDKTWRSRIAHAWLQDGEHGAAGVPFGREVHASDIEEALASTLGDEEAALRRLGLLGFGATADGAPMPPKIELAGRASHGTHVLDLAAGMEPIDDGDMQVQIIAVALPTSVSRDTTGTSLSLFFLHGLEYILQRCRDIAGATPADTTPDIPLFVCASLGFAGGPRQGRHLIERAIDALIQHHVGKIAGAKAENVRVVLPAGNSNLARGHATSDPQVGEATLRVPWRLQPGDQSPNHLEAWITYQGDTPPRIVDLQLTPPGAMSPLSLQLEPGQAKCLEPAQGEGGEAGTVDRSSVVGRVVLEASSAASRGGPLRLSVALAATDPAMSGLPAAPSGAWTVEITARNPDASTTALEIDAWILRDDDPVAHSANARQSYFDCPSYTERDTRGDLLAEDPVEPASVVRRSGTLNAIATGTTREVVGGYVQPPAGAMEAGQFATPARYSGAPLREGRLIGSTTPEAAEKVICAAPCDSSIVLSGVLAAGTRSGSRVAMNGTSVAVPQAVRDMIESDTGPSQDAGKPGPVNPRLGARLIRSRLPSDRASPQGKRSRAD